ncbi:MAG: hypothetical protein MUE59_12725 [Thiobacillaceae bacterium]|nr:hypothetical protein [Thiobacillaceae bacterium]
MNVSLVNALANAMLRDYREVETSADHALNRSDAACVIDCVLSLNRDYDRFVLPRVMRFVQEHPGVTSVAELQFMMRACASPHEFVQLHLGYNHAKRAEILMAVVDYLTTVGDLREWARSADPGGYRQVRVGGFGVTGWQYLRVLFGANTVKPDIHIKRYVERVTGKPIGATVKLVRLFEEASRRAGLRALDASISTVRYGGKARGVFSPPLDIKHSVRRHPK